MKPLRRQGAAPRRPPSLQLRKALAEHQVIFDNAFAGICYLRDRVIVRCNRRFEEMFGFGPGELTGESIAVLYPTRREFERIGRLGYGYLETHETYSDERLMQRRDTGQTFWCRVSGRVLDRDRPSHLGVWIFQDISQQKHAEASLQRAKEELEQRVEERTAELRQALEALREEVAIRQKTEAELRASQEKYRALFEMFPIGISITDAEGNVIEINKQLGRISSLPVLKAITRQVRLRAAGAALINADGRPVRHEELPSTRAIAEQRAVADAELGVRYANGKTRWFQVTAAPIPVPGYGAVVAYAEITERKRMEERERHQQAELARVSRLNTMGEMAGALAHELGQPLSATLNYLHGCQLRLARPEQFDAELFGSALSQAIFHAEQAGSIVRNVRQFVRRHEPESVPTRINDLIGQTVGFLDFERKQFNADVRFELGADLPEVMADPLEIKQVVVNLVKNAFEAMADLPPERRVLVISTRRQGAVVEVAAADCGPGVAKKDLTRIFDAFYTTKPNGVGLGLAVCRTLIESHGGRLLVKRNVEGGATFCFTLPVRSERDTAGRS
ncbi:MAG: PAS domain S-box protein [Nevskia sp.]|nr:PAS domain S-box protein [Nevskia sp.]